MSSMGTGYQSSGCGLFLSTTRSARSSGFVLGPGTSVADGRFTLEGLLGEGAFGLVYRAYDRCRRTDIALKFVCKIPDAPAQTILENELTIQSRITDFAYVIRAFDLHPVDYAGHSASVLSMELAPGGPFSDWLDLYRRDQTARLSQGLHLFEQMCLGVRAYHRSGVAHLDLHPGNFVFSANGALKLTDSGCARYLGPSGYRAYSRWRLSGGGLGAPEFRAPELWRAPADCAGDKSSDVYSLGSLAYLLFSRDCRPPFVGTQEDLRHGHLYLEPPPLTGVPRDIARVVARCLSKL